MDLKELSSALPKPWLNINAHNIGADDIKSTTAEISDIVIDNIEAKVITLINQASVPNPAIGSISIYTDSISGVIHTQDPLGSALAYVPVSGATMTGSLNMGTHNLSNVGTISGATYSRAADNILSEASIGSLTNIPSFSSSAKVLQDSGIATGEISAIQDQSAPIAPLGNRDLWANVSVGSIANILAQMSNGRLFASNNASIQAYTSTNGGSSWSVVVFDVAPTGTATMAFGYNGTIYVALSNTPTDGVYTSADGINFTHNATPGGSWNGSTAYSAFWHAPANLWITGNNSDTESIATSPDGFTWTVHTTPTRTNQAAYYTVFASDGVKVVAAGGDAGGLIYSTNGTSWTACTGGPTVNNAVLIYNPDRAEWYMQDSNTGEGFRSVDGITWASLGIMGAAGPVVGIWVSSLNMYYFAQSKDSAHGFEMVLYSTPSLFISFAGSLLDGLGVDNSGYTGLAYTPSLKQFAIGGGATFGPGYSTARPLDIKAMSDNIRVRGFPVKLGLWAGYSNVTVASSAVETIISSPASSVGSLSLPATQSPGTQLLWDLQGNVTSAAGDSLTFRFKVNGTTILTIPLTIGAGASALPIGLRAYYCIQPANIQIACHSLISALLLQINEANVAYNPTIKNTFSLTAQWGLALSSLTINQSSLVGSFLNGA